MFTRCSWLQINKLGTIVSLFAGSELVYDFYLSGIYRMECIVIILALKVIWKKAFRV